MDSFFCRTLYLKLDFQKFISITREITMKNYISEDVVGEFYKALADENENKLRRVHIPLSTVFYVRAAIEADTGVKYTLDHVERALYLEGMIEAKDVFEPNRKREYG